ncbi:hypothetical protein PtB15_5B448 [Puccinia triticina]|nr:hypothetical protein PtB15_5B448 [Puccinia triticina]
MRQVSSQVPSHFPPQPTPIAITRTTQVRTGGTPNITPSRIINDTPNITPSRIITDTGGQSGESGGPMPPPTIVPTPTRAPVITPSRIIDSTGPHTGHGRTPSVTTRRLANNPPPPNPIIHHGPPIPQPDLMSEDESLVDKVRASTSDDKAHSQYGSMDGFIRPPPPRGPPRITVPSDAQELPPPLAQTPSAVIRPTPQPVHQPPQPSTAVHQLPFTLLIMRRDWDLFPGNVMFPNVPAEWIRVPTALECDIETRSLIAQYGAEPSQEDMAALLQAEVALALAP